MDEKKKRGRRYKADDKLLISLSTGGTPTEAAEYAGVSVNTVINRLKDPAFKDAVNDARTRIFERSIGLFSNEMPESFRVLCGIVHGDYEPRLKLNAAKAMLEFCFRAYAMDTLEKRLDKIERKLAGETFGPSESIPEETG